MLSEEKSQSRIMTKKPQEETITVKHPRPLKHIRVAEELCLDAELLAELGEIER